MVQKMNRNRISSLWTNCGLIRFAEDAISLFLKSQFAIVLFDTEENNRNGRANNIILMGFF